MTKGENYTRIDSFSLGIIFYYLQTGFFPFEGKTRKEIFNKNKHCNIDFSSEVWGKHDPLAKDLCLKLLDKNPLTRICASEALKHPYFNQNFYDTNENISFSISESVVKYKSIISHKLIELNSGENSCISSSASENSLHINKEKANILPSITIFAFSPKRIRIMELSSIKKQKEVPLLKRTLEKEFKNFLEEKKSKLTNQEELKIYNDIKTQNEKSNFSNKILESFGDYWNFVKQAVTDEEDKINADNGEDDIPNEKESSSNKYENSTKCLENNKYFKGVHDSIPYMTPKSNAGIFYRQKLKN